MVWSTRHSRLRKVEERLEAIDAIPRDELEQSALDCEAAAYELAAQATMLSIALTGIDKATAVCLPHLRPLSEVDRDAVFAGAETALKGTALEMYLHGSLDALERLIEALRCKLKR